MTVNRAKSAAFSAALEAGKFIRDRLGNIKQIDYKSAFNIVTDVDRASEKMILEILKSEFPDDSYLAEEGGGHEAKKTNRRWYVDPLDGTTNFTHSYPFFCVSIGMEEAGQMIVGVVYNPIADELFYAERGQGAFLNDEPIHVSSIGELSHSLLATGFPPDTGVGKPHNNMVPFTSLTNLSHGVRRDGSAALDLCFVACGRLEGFWELKLAPWDIAAGSLIVEEAGGKVSDLCNGPLDMPTGHILATNRLIHDEMVGEMKKLDLK
ncbi:MAG: inositol monophosphatase [Cyanobacteria bacterium SZAS-4]|nr:inositol monophosphatase [Cyanobacteria bacterium SZAS-4]